MSDRESPQVPDAPTRPSVTRSSAHVLTEERPAIPFGCGLDLCLRIATAKPQSLPI